jgi:hypothetical protein
MIGENEKTLSLSLSTNTGCKPSTESAEDPNYFTPSSVGMVYNYEPSGQLHKKTPPGKKQGFFVEKEVKALAEGITRFFEMPVTSNIPEKDGLVFCQATLDDMEGVYKVAASLFGSTTSSEARKPLIQQCPEGNYIVKRNDQVVAYVHIQPLKHDRLMAFMRGEKNRQSKKLASIVWIIAKLCYN